VGPAYDPGMMRVLGVSIAAAALLALPGAAGAQKSGAKLQDELEGPQTDKAPAATEVHGEGEYGGVVPGKATEHPPHKGRKPVLTWIGFRPKGDGGQFFVQLTREAEVQQDVAGNKLLVTISGARFASRNARRRLDTRFFATSVAEVQPKAVGRQRARKGKPGHPAGVQLVITFKNPSDVGTASLRTGSEQDGYYYVFLDFGPGTAAGGDSE